MIMYSPFKIIDSIFYFYTRTLFLFTVFQIKSYLLKPLWKKDQIFDFFCGK